MEKKKKKKQVLDAAIIAGNDASAGNSSNVSVDIKTLFKDHANFFDKLIDLIPAKFYYLPTSDDKPWFQGLLKKEKAQEKLKSFENTKKPRRDRLDPEKSSKSTLYLLNERLEIKKLETVASGVDNSECEGGGLTLKNLEDGKRSVTYEELRQRLHRRIEELRASCGEERRRRAEKREMKDGRKRWRNDEKAEDDAAKEERESENKSKRAIEKEVSEAVKDNEFGKVKLAAPIDEVNKKKKRRKMSKDKELQIAIKLEEEKKDPEKGDELAKKHSWKAATDPKLLKKSLQKDKKKQKKSAEKRKQRVETTEKMKKGKQDKRSENIKANIDIKKQFIIDKREKKLMRPGFEGRKEGFLTGN